MASTLRLDTALYGAAIMVDRLLGFFLLPLLTRAIAPADYGAWTQTSVACGLLVALVLFGAPTAVVRYFSGVVAWPIRRRYLLRLGAFALLLFAFVAALAVALPAPLSLLVYGEPGRQGLLPILLLLLAADAATEFASAWLRAAGRIGGVAVALVARSAVRYGVVLLLVDGPERPLAEWFGSYALVQFALAAAVLAAAIAALRAAASLDARTAEAPASASGSAPGALPSAGTAEAPAGCGASAPPRASLRLAELVAYSVPLAALSLLTSLNSMLDRFLLVQWLGLESVAVYAAAVSLCSIPAALYSVLGFTLFPELARRWQERRLDAASALMSAAVQVFLFLCLPIAAVLALAGPVLLPLLATASYAAPPAVFALLGLSVAAYGCYQILLYALLLDGRSRQVLVLAAAATLLNLALNLVLVRAFGISGAAGAVAASNLIMMAVALRLVRPVAPLRFPWRELRTIAGRTALSVLPLSAALAAGAGAGPLLAATVLGGVGYLVLDRRRPDSILRLMLGR